MQKHWLQRQDSNLRSSGHEPDGDAAPLLCRKPLSGFGAACEKKLLDESLSHIFHAYMISQTEYQILSSSSPIAFKAFGCMNCTTF